MSNTPQSSSVVSSPSFSAPARSSLSGRRDWRFGLAPLKARVVVGALALLGSVFSLPGLVAPVQAQSDVSVTSTAPASVLAGANLTYAATVTHKGPDTATDVSLSIPLPEGTTFVSSTQTGGGTTFIQSKPAVGTNGTVSASLASWPLTTVNTPTGLLDVDGTLFFSANIGTTGAELWKSDGTAAGTVMVKDIYSGVGSSNPDRLTNVGGTLFFTATTPTTGVELWKSDGTEAGTVMVKDIYSSGVGSTPGRMVNVGGTVYFAATDATNGGELWKSDGTADGTVLVKDIFPGTSGSGLTSTSGPSHLANVDGTLFFQANNGTIGRELWKIDADGNAVLVKDINPGSGNSTPQLMTNVNGTLFFSASAAATGNELWKSDGTADGTVLVKDIIPGTSGPQIQGLVNVGGTLYLTVNEPTYGQEVWKSDGTAAGTVILKDINPGASHASPGLPTLVGNTLYFQAFNFTHGRELWKSDATEGAVLVKDILPGGGDSSPNRLANIDGTLYFSANDGTNGIELWKSDGTEAGTVLFKDIIPGAGSSSPNTVTKAGGALYFSVHPNNFYSQLWKSDGTAAGTFEMRAAVAATFSIVMKVQTAARGTLSNTATLTVGNDSTSGDDSSTATTSITAPPATDLSISKTAPTNGTSGENLTYSLTVQTVGMSRAYDVILEDVLPAGTTFVSATQTSGPTFTQTTPAIGDGGTFGASIASLNGATATFELVVKIDDGKSGTLSNTATIRSSNDDSNTAGNSSTATTTIPNRVPTDITLSSQSVTENAGANATVGTLSATDADTDDTFTFSLPADTDDNSLFNIEGTTLRANATFDYETKTSYLVTVRVVDAAGNSFDKQFTVTINNINDVPSFTKGSDQSATNSLGAQRVTNWATNLSTGDGAGQALDFIVGLNDGASDLFSVQPAISADGTLTYTPQAGQVGVATVSVQIHDDGGTENGGVDTSATQTFTINVKEDVRPDVAISAPSNNQRVHLSELGAGSIRGIASDNLGVTQVRVMVRRYRGTSFSYWNGSTFTTTNTLVNATLTNTGTDSTDVTWSLDTPIPASELDAGVYYLSALANDGAFNSRYSATHTITLYGDSTAPGVAVLAPTQKQRLQTNALVSGSINGSASDNVGVTSVRLLLRRFRGSSGTGSYWNGSSFVSTHATVNATLSGTGTNITWSLDSAIPAAQLDVGTYFLSAIATDAAGNSTHSTTREFILYNDTVAPSATIAAPTQKQRLHLSELGAGSINGSATDSVGVKQVKIVLRRFRSSGAAYWNGSSFVSSHTPVSTTVTGSGTNVTWSLNSAIPAEQLDVGTYYLTAISYDAAGNTTYSTSREFIVHNDGTTTPTSTLGSSAGGS